MTNVMFWSLVPAAIGVFLLIAWLTDRALCAIERVYRRWACRREMARMREEMLRPRAFAYRDGDVFVSGTAANEYDMQSQIDAERRQQLEGLATAQDKQTRRIVH